MIFNFFDIGNKFHEIIRQIQYTDRVTPDNFIVESNNCYYQLPQVQLTFNKTQEFFTNRILDVILPADIKTVLMEKFYTILQKKYSLDSKFLDIVKEIIINDTFKEERNEIHDYNEHIGIESKLLISNIHNEDENEDENDYKIKHYYDNWVNLKYNDTDIDDSKSKLYVMYQLELILKAIEKFEIPDEENVEQIVPNVLFSRLYPNINDSTDNAIMVLTIFKI